MRLFFGHYGRAAGHVTGSGSSRSARVFLSEAAEVKQKLWKFQPGSGDRKAGGQRRPAAEPPEPNHGPPGPAAEGVVHRGDSCGHPVGQTAAQRRRQRR